MKPILQVKAPFWASLLIAAQCTFGLAPPARADFRSLEAVTCNPMDDVDVPSRSPAEVPPRLAKRLPTQPFGCRRQYRFQEKVQNIDSYYKQDGEMLRPAIQSVPQALQSLNRYQNNIASARTAAYIGTIGLLMAFSSIFFNVNNPTQMTIRTIGLAGGLGLATTSFIISFSVLRSNESNLRDAVNYYNKARPNDPIQLQFSTSILF